MLLNEALAEQLETCAENIVIRISFINPTTESTERYRHSKESKWAKKSWRLCPRMGLFLVEAGMHSSCLCFVVFPFSLAHF